MSHLSHVQLQSSFKGVAAAGVLALSVMLGGCATSDESGTSTSADASWNQQQIEPTPVKATVQPGGQSQQRMLAIPTGDQGSSAFLLEKEMPTEVRLNKPFEYNLRVTNKTDQPLHDIVIREQVPEGMSISRVSTATTRPTQGGVVEYNIGNLGPRQSKTITVTAIASQPGVKDTCATVNYTPSLCVSTNVVNPMLRLSKAAPSELDICEPLVYRYTVRNEGTGTERNVRIEDRLPDGVTTQDGRNMVSINVGDLPAGQSREQTVTLKANRTGRFSSPAVAMGADAERVEAQAVATTVRAPRLDVKIDGPQTAFLNKPVTYRVTVRNTGDSPARDLSLNLQGPNGTEVVWGQGGQPQLLSAGQVQAEERRVQQEPMRQQQTQEQWRQTDDRERYHKAGGPGQPEFNLVPGEAGRSAGTSDQTRTDRTTGMSGTTGGTGTSGTTGAGARGEVAVGGTGARGSVETGGGMGMASGQQTLPALAPGQSRTFDVTVPNPQPGTLNVVANAQARCAQPASASAQTNIQALAALLLTVVDETDPIRLGDTVVYNITVKNQGAGDDRNVRITATLPPGEQFIDAGGPTPAQVNGQTVTFGAIDTLRGGQTVVWRVRVKAQQAGDVRFKVSLDSQALTSGPATAEEPTRLY